MLDKADLHPYQIETVTRLYENNVQLAIVPMGGGKTVSGLTAFQELQRDGHVRKGVILAPKRVARNVWPGEVENWEHLNEGQLIVQVVDGNPSQRLKKLANDLADLYVIGIDNTQWLTEIMQDWEDDDPRLDILMIDELSRYKRPNGKRARALCFVADRFKMRWGFTGSPCPNNEIDLYQPARILTRAQLWDMPFSHWREKYFMPEDPFTRLRWHLREEWREQIWSDVAQFSFTVPAERLPPQPDLPPVVHEVELPRRALLAYQEMLRHLITEAGGEEIFAENMGVASGKLDQIAQGFIYKDGETMEILHREKQRMLAELVDGLGGDQAMITYWFAEDLILIKELFPDIPVLGAETKEKDEAQIIAHWNAGRSQLIAVHPASAGHGLNLQKSHAGQIIHFCQTWSAELFEQVNARIARQGNERERVFNHLIVARGTLDEVKRARVTEKLDHQAAFMNYVKDYQP